MGTERLDIATEPMVKTWLDHVRALADGIGPRGSATPGERRGSEYCAGVFKSLGYTPQTEEFPSVGTVFGPHLVAALGMLLSFLIYPLFRPATAYLAAALALVTVVSEVLELALKANPLRWVLPRRASRNVFAVAEPAGEIERDVVLMGHVDTQRTPIIFSGRRWLAAYNILSAVAFAAFIVQTAFYAAGALLRLGWVWPASLATLPFVLLLLALTIHAELTPHTPGANDNATAAGLVLTLAGALRGEPLRHTRVWLVCTGSEESLHEGARHFFARHKQEMREPRTINFEMLGCAGPAWLVREGIVTPLHPSPELLSLAERVARENPGLGAYPARLAGGVTEASDSVNAGVPAITLMGMTRDNQAPYWHRMTDTTDKMDPAVMLRAYGFALKMLGGIDRPD